MNVKLSVSLKYIFYLFVKLFWGNIRFMYKLIKIRVFNNNLRKRQYPVKSHIKMYYIPSPPGCFSTFHKAKYKLALYD